MISFVASLQKDSTSIAIAQRSNLTQAEVLGCRLFPESDAKCQPTPRSPKLYSADWSPDISSRSLKKSPGG